MNTKQDAFGAELMAAYETRGQRVFEVIEREDGLISISVPRMYFADHQNWPKRHQDAAGLAKGRVLDIGSGAGRIALHLQRCGYDVIAIDKSPGAIKVCKMRGVRRVRLIAIEEIHIFKANTFDTVMMMGNNFGLFGSFNKARRLLKELARITAPDGQIIADVGDPYQTKDPQDRSYQRYNRKRGRMAGQLRIRVRHGLIVGEWFDYLMVSRKELQEIIAGTVWRVAKILSDRNPGYTAILKK
jgi:SAM-dependent methyltransferase